MSRQLIIDIQQKIDILNRVLPYRRSKHSLMKRKFTVGASKR